MNSKLVTAINRQINEEFYSAYLYLAFAAQAATMKLPGISHWFTVQYQEELDHAMGFFKYLILRRVNIELEIIKKPAVKITTVSQLFNASLKHEQYITGTIHNLFELANSQKDHATAAFLQWYIDEQVEEESSVQNIIDQLKMIGDNLTALLILDNQLTKREYKQASILNR